MSQTSMVKEAQRVGTGKQTPPLRLPDAASTAEITLAQALAYCAEKMGLASTDLAVERLRQGDRTACSYCGYSVARQVAEALGSLDGNIQTVYIFEYDATPEDLCSAEAMPSSPIHLLVWTARKTGALSSLVEVLDRALAQNYARLIGHGPSGHMLDVQIIDNADVETRSGYGALLASLYHRPIKVWER